MELSEVNVQAVAARVELREEHQMGRAFWENQTAWQDKFQQLEEQFSTYQEEKVKLQERPQLCEQLRDEMFYLEPQRQISELSDHHKIAERQIVGTSHPRWLLMEEAQLANMVATGASTVLHYISSSYSKCCIG
ncbi:uncharacterized protein LOC126418618 [Schistocerca serialis cubense]|uniref:uncharacterized protein LOC126418618 n=1 Tax=Schistocerca serialis cubense TaxID=2023355 RepID=UPI00214EF7D4|nr:uncharacterized protein LOC126418618 [Schistocerca serialis cubense]